MKEQSSYFSHDSNARNDAKIVTLRMRHGAAGYGVYFMILERLREESGYMSVKDYNMVAFDLRVDANLVKSVVEDFGLFAFTEDGECFYSESFNRRMSKMDDIRKARSEAGKKAMAKRYRNNTNEPHSEERGDAETSQTDNNGNSVITDLGENGNNKKKVKERKDKEKKESKEKANASPSNGSAFTAPALSEVKAYITEKELTNVDASTFMAYYESNGWKVGRNKMRSWRAALCMWNARNKRGSRSSPGNENKPFVVLPSADDAEKERRLKAEEERKRVFGIYRMAQEQPGSRYVKIVEEWARNGTLAKYGLEPLSRRQ